MYFEQPEENIIYFKGVIKNYQEIIDIIESVSNDALSDWEPWNGHGTNSRYGDIKHVKRDQILYINSDEDRAKTSYAVNTLANRMSDCMSEYANIFNIDRKALYYAVSLLTDPRTTMGINKYDQNAFMGAHVDFNEDNYYLAYTVVVYLNDDYEGGELYFNDLDIKIKPEAGSIIMYPSSLPYTHQSMEVTKGRKMLITHHWQMILPPNG